MSFLSKLKAVGKGILKVLPLASQALPVAVSVATGNAAAGAVVASVLERISAAVGFAERTAAIVQQQQGVGMDGKAKLALALSIANESVSVTEVVAGRNIVDNDKFQRGTKKFEEGVAKLVEAVADIEDSIQA